MFLFKTKQISNIIKRFSLIVFVMLLFVNQVSALPTLITFGENHEASIVSSNGKTFLKLEHIHKHGFHHQSIKKAEHGSRSANLFNGHDGKHTDHLIRISDKEEHSSTSYNLNKMPNLKYHSAVKLGTAVVQMNLDLQNKVKDCQRDRSKTDLNLIKYSIQFLV